MIPKTAVAAQAGADLILWRHDETDHGCAIAAGRLQSLDELRAQQPPQRLERLVHRSIGQIGFSGPPCARRR